MRRTGRLRRVLKWGGLVLSLLIAAAWAVSIRWEVGQRVWDRPRFYLRAGLIAGRLVYAYDAAPRPTPRRSFWFFERNPWPAQWFLEVDKWGNLWSISLPLWIPFLLVATPAAILWWRDRRFPPGHCQHCGYDLTGNTSGTCPECGSLIRIREQQSDIAAMSEGGHLPPIIEAGD